MLHGPSTGTASSSFLVYALCGRRTSSSASPFSTKRAVAHHVDAVGHQPRDPEVVGDHQHADSGALLQFQQQVEDAGLHGDVQRAGGFVGDDQFGAGRQGAGDQHPLQHAAGELMGILRQLRGPAPGCEPARAARRPARSPPLCHVPRCGAPLLASWPPMVCTGLSAVIGSCGISATCLPRTSTRAFGLPSDVGVLELHGPGEHREVLGQQSAGCPWRWWTCPSRTRR